MRLVLLVEGQTEKIILKELNFLAAFTSGFSAIEVLDMRGSGKLKNEFKTIAEIELKTNPETYVFCLIDVHEAPFNFPRYIQTSAEPITAQYEYIQQYMKNKIEPVLRERFFVFPIIMEVETWFLADNIALKEFFGKELFYANPENVSQPVEELKRLLWQNKKRDDYDKVYYAQRIFQKVSAQRVYDDNCPHFIALIHQLMQLQGIELPRSQPQFQTIDSHLFAQLTILENEKENIWKKVEITRDLTSAQIARIEEIEAEISQIWQDIVSRYPP